MDIKSAEKSHQDITFGDDSYENLLNELQDFPVENNYHFCLFIGKPNEKKQKALHQIAEKSNKKIKEIDANEIISKIESETYKKWEHVFAHFSPEDTLLYIKNGARFNGEYTGYTNSAVRYATPQERYFLTILQKKGGLFVVDVDADLDADTTLHRVAQSIVKFPKPKSGLKKLMWNLKHITVHGYQIKTKRPDRYRKDTSDAV